MIMMMILFIVLLIADLISKALIVKFTEATNSVVVIKNFFNITYVKNTGAAFSILDDRGIVVLVISSLMIGGLSFYLYKHRPSKKIEKVAYTLIISGAVGNFFNRLFLGYVIDFLDFKIFEYYYPIFNIADIYIVLGVFLLIISAWRDHVGNNS